MKKIICHEEDKQTQQSLTRASQAAEKTMRCTRVKKACKESSADLVQEQTPLASNPAPPTLTYTKRQLASTQKEDQRMVSNNNELKRTPKFSSQQDVHIG